MPESALFPILVLDDDPIVAMLIHSITGHEIKHFKNSNETLEHITELNPTACFVDIHLGVKDNGLETIPRLREAYPHTPIIVLSGSPDKTIIADALASGADDFIRKPLNKEEVNARLQVRTHEHHLRKNQTEILFGDLKLDTHQRYISSESTKEIRYISSTDVNLLLCFIESKGNILKRHYLKQRCWGPTHVTDNALNRKICEIRKIIGELSLQIKIRTVYGAGFVLED
ncbi:MAG: response regulator transcription factor [Oligoflexales bacterium]